MASFSVSPFFAAAVVKSPFASEWEVVYERVVRKGCTWRGARLVHKTLHARAAKKRFTQTFHHVFQLFPKYDAKWTYDNMCDGSVAVAKAPYRSYFE